MKRCTIGLLFLMVCAVGVANPASASLRFSFTELPEMAVILVEGEFEPSDDLFAFTQLVGEHHPQFVTFNSKGGNVVKAVELGRAIRKAGLSTVQIREMECASACAFAFFGGVIRAAAPGAIGMHKVSLPPSSTISANDAARSVQDLTALILRYLREMGIDPAVLELALAYDAGDIRYLSGAEMTAYNVVTASTAAQQPPPSPASEETSGPTSDTAAVPPVARSGKVRHPKGFAPLKAVPSENADDLASLPNGSPLEIGKSLNGWYGATINGRTGYLHHSWVFVDQFVQDEFERRYIQIKSFNSLVSAEDYIRASQLPLAAMLATNGWFAVTIDGTLSFSAASQMLQRLKVQGLVDSDSYVTYGNTYIAKVCCAHTQ